MPAPRRTLKRLKTAACLAALAAAAGAGLVSAQPAPLAGMQAPQGPGNATVGRPGGPLGNSAVPHAAPSADPQAPPEEAPPASVQTPAPLIVPPISANEVAPVPVLPKPQAQPEKPPEPLRRARYDVAVLQALDKVTAETLVFEAPIGKRIRYKGLIFTVSACERSTPEEPVEDSIAYLTIESQPRAEAGRPTPPAKQVFRGWMYASSPSLNPLQHPSYDAWVINCRAAAPAPGAATVASR